VSGGAFACGRDQAANVKAVIEDILGHGNDNVFLPGQDFAAAAKRTQAAGGLLFSAAEIGEFNELAREVGMQEWDLAALAKA